MEISQGTNRLGSMCSSSGAGRAVILLAGKQIPVSVLTLSVESALVRSAEDQDVLSLAAGVGCTVRFLSNRGESMLAIPAVVAFCATDGRARLELCRSSALARSLFAQFISAAGVWQTNGGYRRGDQRANPGEEIGQMQV